MLALRNPTDEANKQIQISIERIEYRIYKYLWRESHRRSPKISAIVKMV
jgi:hypothetical protein